MVDFGTALFAAGLSVAQKLLFRWISEGKSTVRVSSVDAAVASEARVQANQLRMRVDDLEQATQQILSEIVASSPRLSYAKTRFHSSLVMKFDPNDPYSSKSLLTELKARVNDLGSQSATSIGGEVELVLPPGASLAAGQQASTEPAEQLESTGPESESSKLLAELRSRVEQTNETRK